MRPAWRPLAALVLSACVAALVLVTDVPEPSTAVLAGIALRLGCGWPELARLVRVHGRDAVVDLVVEIVGGAAVALLVVLGSRRVEQLPPAALVLAVLAGGLLLLPIARALRYPRER